MNKIWNSANWQESVLHRIVMGIARCALIGTLITVGVPQARAVEQNSEVAFTARKLQLEGARLQLQGKLEEAVKKYRDSIALQPDPRLESLIKQLEPKISKKEEDAPVAIVASEPQALSTTSQAPAPVELHAGAESQPTQSTDPALASSVKMSPDMLYKQGEEAFLSSDYKKAMELFEMAAQGGPYLMDNPDMVCMMTQSADRINDIQKYKEYSSICYKNNYKKKITGKLVKIESIKEKSVMDYIICIKLHNGKVYCDGINLGTQISSKEEIIYDDLKSDSSFSEKRRKLDDILREKVKLEKNIDIYIELGSNSFIQKLNIND